jgi:serine O-acetyltransferase
MNHWDAIKADTHRQYGQFSWGNLIKGFITIRTFRPVVTLRLCQVLSASHGLVRLALPIGKLLHRMATHTAAMDLPWRTEIGSGLTLIHGWSLVITKGSRIGNNVTLFHGVTLGRRDRISHEGERLTEYPVIEDEVWIGPHAIIVGGITIGRGSRIAGGAFVTDNIPPYSVVSGNPGVIVKSNCVPDVMNPAPV